MIGSLKGKVTFISKDYLLLETTGGVGYIIFTLAEILQNAKIGGQLSLLTETIVREDSIKIFGFNNAEEKRIFLRLATVKGIGAKTALIMLSQFSAYDIVMKIIEGDVKSLSTVPGIGKKTAERVITELKDGFKKENLQELGSVTADAAWGIHTAADGDGSVIDADGAIDGASANASEAGDGIAGAKSHMLNHSLYRKNFSEATSALVNLGYNESEIINVLNSNFTKEQIAKFSTEGLIKASLKLLANI